MMMKTDCFANYLKRKNLNYLKSMTMRNCLVMNCWKMKMEMNYWKMKSLRSMN